MRIGTRIRLIYFLIPLIILVGCENSQVAAEKTKLLNGFFCLTDSNSSCDLNFDSISISYDNSIVVAMSNRTDAIDRFRLIFNDMKPVVYDLGEFAKSGFISIYSRDVKYFIPIYERPGSNDLLIQIVIPGDKGGWSLFEIPSGKIRVRDFLKSDSSING